MMVFSDLFELKRICKKYDRIFLYGAGTCACFYTEILKQWGLCVTSYIVSDDIKKRQSEGRLTPVRTIDEEKISDADLVIIAAINEGQISEMEKHLAVKNVLRFCDDEKAPWHYVNREKAARQSRTMGFFSDEKELQAIGEKEGTDKAGYWHNYCNKYEYFLEKWKDEEIILVELGVYQGASIRMWREFFSKAKIIGVDINPNCLEYQTNDINILIKDMGDKEALKTIRDIKPSVIIDDASHLWSHQINALFSLYSGLMPGGIYILEDICTSFIPESSGYDDQKMSTYHIVEMISRGVVGGSVYDLLQEVDVEYRTSIAEMIKCTEAIVNMGDSVMFIKR